jgi:tyrosinase
VTDGPFAMTMARYVDLHTEPHCLSRNFRNDTGSGHFIGHLIRPELIEKTLAEDDLLLFTLKLESGPHNTIPMGIRGDFLSFNAPAGRLLFKDHIYPIGLWFFQTLIPSFDL